jgi:hypothetical protein
MRFDEPKVLVDGAAHLSEQIGGARVTCLVRPIDGLADLLPVARERGGDGVDVREAVGDAHVIRLECGALRNRLRGAVHHAAHLHGALGDVVAPLLRVLGDLVEELVDGDEAGTFDVPVSLLELVEEVFRVDQSVVQELHHLAAQVAVHVVLGRVHPVLLILRFAP